MTKRGVIVNDSSVRLVSRGEVMGILSDLVRSANSETVRVKCAEILLSNLSSASGDRQGVEKWRAEQLSVRDLIGRIGQFTGRKGLFELAKEIGWVEMNHSRWPGGAKTCQDFIALLRSAGYVVNRVQGNSWRVFCSGVESEESEVE